MLQSQLGLLLTLVLGVSASSSHLFKRAVVCPATPPPGNARTNCGTTATTQATCQATGCCWSPLPAGETGPACFVGPDADCPALNGTQRRDCGNVNTTAASCVASGCCFARLPTGQTGPNCYFKPSVLASLCPATPLAANLRVNCGNATTTSKSCTLSGCCWQALPAGTAGPNCYKYTAPSASSSAISSTAASTSRPASSTASSTRASSTAASSTASSTRASSTAASSTAASSTVRASSTVASSATVTTVAATPTATALTCPATALIASQRVDCGTVTTTQASCLASGCCFNPLPAGTTGPACYFPPDPQCPVLGGAARTDCGNVNTTAASCMAAGCCFVPVPLGQTGPSCFFKPSVLATVCPATPLAGNLRTDCGNAQTTSQSCLLSGCCWQPVPAGTTGPNCYRYTAPAVSSSSVAASSTVAASSSVVASSTVAATSSVAASSTVTATTAVATATATALACPATPVVASQRIDCGDITTTPESCVASGCCWNVLPAGTAGPYCYRPPAPNTNMCPIPAYPSIARRECPQADATTTPAKCLEMGCCWDTLPAGTPGPNCYMAGATAPGFGPPGSDPGTKLTATTANPGNYAVIGNSPVVPIAIAPVPNTNHIILLERIAGGKTGTAHSYTMDLGTNQFSPVPFDSDLFCVGGALLPDGRIFNMGGWTGDISLRGMRFFKTGDPKWIEDPTKAKLLVPRWYPTALVRPDGKVIVFGGATDMQPPGVNQPNAEILPGAPGDQVITIPLLVQTEGSNLYPIAYIIPPDANSNTPRVWLFASARSQLLDMNTLATIAELPAAPPGQGQGARVYPLQGGHAMLPLVADAQNNYPPAEIVICGGGTGFNDQALAMDTCVRTTPSRGAAAVWEIDTMPSPRIFADMVALPDGTYLVLNGAGKGWSGFASSGNPQKTALLYNPKAANGQRFTVLASTDVARLYHAEAILALDGRVIVTGSTPNYDGNVDNTLVIHPNEHTVEAYSPPYLTNGKTRPTLTSFTKEASGGWNYNTVYNITATIPSGDQTKISVTLITQGFITHSVHMGERTIMPWIAGITANGGNSFTISVRSPRDANIAQPQYYSLWVLDNGTPSVAQWVQIGGVPAATGPAWPFGA